MDVTRNPSHADLAEDAAAPKISINFWPWHRVRDILSNTNTALKHYPYDTVYLCDEYQYTDIFTALAAITSEFGVSVGTFATFVSRNPLSLAQKFASISELLPAGKELVAGFASGGAVQRQVMLKHPAPTAQFEESVVLLSRLLAGEVVELAEFPNLGQRFDFNMEGRAKLYFPPQQRVPVCVAAGGVRSLEIAARHGDGVMLGLLHPVTCLTAMRHGLFQERIRQIDKTRQDVASSGREFRKIFAIQTSVSRDRQKARDLAKRQMSYALATFMPHFPVELGRLGITAEEVERTGIQVGFQTAAGLEEIAKRMSDELLDKSTFLAAGTGDEARETCLQVVPFLKAANFDEIIIAVPLGPNLEEALEIIGKEIAPAIRAAFA